MKRLSSEKKSSSIHRLIPRSKLFTKGFPAQTNSQLQSFFLNLKKDSVLPGNPCSSPRPSRGSRPFRDVLARRLPNLQSVHTLSPRSNRKRSFLVAKSTEVVGRRASQTAACDLLLEAPHLDTWQHRIVQGAKG